MGHVVELTRLDRGALCDMPESADVFLGVANLRGRVAPIMDLRRVLGEPTLAAEVARLTELLETREADHVRWIDALLRSVEEGWEFPGATSSHACGFGEWLDGLLRDEAAMHRVTRGSPAIEKLLRDMEAPHARIHAVAAEVRALADGGDAEGACALVERTRVGELDATRHLFARTREAVGAHEWSIVAVIESDDEWLGLVVDGVRSVASLAMDSIDDMPAMATTGRLTDAVAKDPKTGELTTLLDVEALLAGVSGVAPGAGAAA